MPQSSNTKRKFNCFLRRTSSRCEKPGSAQLSFLLFPDLIGTINLLISAMKWFTTAVIISQLSLHQSTGQDIFECNICGDGKQVHNASGIISIPPSTEDNCAELEFLGSRGSIDETTCALLQPLAQIPCDCRDVDIPATNDTEAPTSTPTELPTFGPPPDCYSDLNEILERDWLFTEDEVEYIPRTYTICPDTVYQMGVITSSGHGVEYTGGFDALVPRPNSHYKCGESGLLSNNCVLTGGSWPIIGYGGDLQMLNVTFEGFVIESAVEGGVILSKPGDITFIDCVFRVSTTYYDMVFSSTSFQPNIVSVLPFFRILRTTKILVWSLFCTRMCTGGTWLKKASHLMITC